MIKENNESKELLFIPFSQPAEMIDKTDSQIMLCKRWNNLFHVR